MKASPLICACCVALVAVARAPASLPARSAQRQRMILIRNILFGISETLSFPRKFWELEAGGNVALGTVARPTVAVDDTVRERLWRDVLHKDPPPRHSCTLPNQTSSPPRRRRARRHVLTGPRAHLHGQVMRVGCVLGTCQVQNLSHRLYQLIGQSGREDSSPVNPKSPHSYG